MKLNFSKLVGRLRTKSLPLLAGLILSPLVVMGDTSPIYINTGTISGTPPQVDATTFVNNGAWNISTYPSPYKTSHTLNYTNKSSMIGSVGWEFDLGPSTVGGPRGMSANFFNDNNAIIEADDSYILNPIGLAFNTYQVSYLWISATNVVNKGQLIAGAAGEMKLTGSNMNLSRSHLEITSISDSGSTCSENDYANSRFFPATAIYDEYWGGGSITNVFSPDIWDGIFAISPGFNVNGLCDVRNAQARIGFLPTLADSTNDVFLGTLMVGDPPVTNITVIIVPDVSTNYVTNITQNLNTVLVPTNEFRQAVFVVGDTNVLTDIENTFYNTGNFTNLFKIATVRLGSAYGDLYLVDQLGASNNTTFLSDANYVPGSNPETPCTDPTYRPANYILSRADCYGYFNAGSPGIGTPADNFLYDLTFSNAFVMGNYAGYYAYADNLARNPSGAALTNLPGRIIINAGNLDLTRTTIYDPEAEVVIKADNLLSITGATVSCRNLSFDVGSASGNLNITNLSAATSFNTELSGPISAFSIVWTNYETQISAVWTDYVSQVVYTNYDTNGVKATLTNQSQINIHVLLVDASGLFTKVPVTIQDFILHSTNMTVSDPITVARTLLFDGRSLTLRTNLTLSGDVQSWSWLNAPTLLYFTNNGVLSIPYDAHFGDDGPTNYAAFVNYGTIITSNNSITINSDYFQNDGTLYAIAGGVFVTASTGKVENASIISGEDADFSGGTLQLSNTTISAKGHLYFNLTNALYDAGSSGNTLTCTNGFSLLSEPTIGTLMGTTIRSVALNGAEVDHVWAAVDRGNTQAGFSNNVVVRNLVLTDDGSEPLFVFSGASANNGLYVSNLDLSGLSDPAYENEIQIAPNLNIYYITNSPLGAWVYLNSHFAGHFIHAASGITPYVGNPPSGPSPKFAINCVGSGQIQFTVNDGYVAGQTYIVEASTNLSNWVPIFTTNAPPSGLFQFIIPDASSYPTRFYRVVPQQ